ncbi:hypothetical protein GCM10007216_08380 [Thalassobacillus devorans]|uniref:DUF3055 domain-containing protein n=1 Tax=Thalassobacillus devorans TaxID=279813 RepID=A0ABQ1NP29_9BACI|nr:DUF3055 domain-containing protein [Thalassobacillus devorans]NIK27750.1 hypothetical protein [Thalassobacillus devorans]GGC80190.1 hypothetical protein GCM10007216_08380 [Thalassobacillus devorans]
MYMEKLYDEMEQSNVRFVGFTTKEGRYDFGIVYTSQFFGKPLVVCMQSGQSSLLDSSDVKDLDFLQKKFRLPDKMVAMDLADFLNDVVPPAELMEASYE